MLDSMSKERVLAELEQLDEKDLEEIQVFVSELLLRRKKKNGVLRLEDLQDLMFEGPEDMSEQHDKYALQG